jgi:hypothetical protein
MIKPVNVRLYFPSLTYLKDNCMQNKRKVLYPQLATRKMLTPRPTLCPILIQSLKKCFTEDDLKDLEHIHS